jgi:hypothetical protein
MMPEQDVHSIAIHDASDGWSLTDDGPAAQPVLPEKTSWAPGRDERRSERCAVPPDRRTCELKVGPRVLPALLADESDGGFAVVVDNLADLKAGKKVKLHTEWGWFTVQIVYVRKVARPANADSKSDCWFRLGLKKKSGFLFF